MKIAIRHLEAFVAVASHGNFSTAARHLDIAQPALSQAIKDLEAALGLRLFDRTTRRVELTAAGREFQGSTSKILEDLQHAVQNVRDLATRRRGRVRIAAPPLLASAILPRAIAKFRADFPGIAVELTDVGTEQIVQSVVSGAVDCAIGTFSPSEEGIERTLLMRDSLILFCRKQHRAAVRPTFRWRDLRDEDVIMLTRSSGLRLLTEVGLESAGVSVKPAFEVSLISTALALVEAGLGITVLPSYALAAARHHAVVGKPLVEPVISRDVVLVHASGRSISPAVASFSTVLCTCAHQLVPSQ